MTFQPSAPHKRSRWLVLLAVVMLATGMLATSALAAPEFNFIVDNEGANDEPGQKDLTADATAIDPVNSDYYTAWKWDAISWSGNNTGDACSLFDTTGEGNADYAVCVTIGKPAIETSTRVYSCGDTRPDRCTGSVLEGTEDDDSSGVWCSVELATATYPDNPAGGDTQATCNITLIATDLGITGLDNGTFLNSCSYPSEQPNSDPSDCVHQLFTVDVGLSTTSGGSMSWDATLTDTATLTPAGTGSVTFKLYLGTPCVDPAEGITGNLVATSTDTAFPFAATPVPVSGTGSVDYYWTVTYNPDTGFNGDEELCGERITISASILGSSAPTP